MDQILTENERKSIRANIYTENENQPIDYNDKKISFFVKHCRGKTVLDLGSVDHYEENWKSKYWLFKAIAENAKDIMGIDYYEKGVGDLKAKGFNIVYGDAQKFNVEKKYDVITAGDLIEHLQDLDGFINSIKAALIENGTLIISTPNPWCWKYILYHMIYGKMEPVNREHVSWFCIKTIENLFARYGFEVTEYSYTSRRLYEKYVPLPSRIKHTTLNVLLRKVL